MWVSGRIERAVEIPSRERVLSAVITTLYKKNVINGDIILSNAWVKNIMWILISLYMVHWSTHNYLMSAETDTIGITDSLVMARLISSEITDQNLRMKTAAVVVAICLRNWWNIGRIHSQRLPKNCRLIPCCLFLKHILTNGLKYRYHHRVFLQKRVILYISL